MNRGPSEPNNAEMELGTEHKKKSNRSRKQNMSGLLFHFSYLLIQQSLVKGFLRDLINVDIFALARHLVQDNVGRGSLGCKIVFIRLLRHLVGRSFPECFKKLGAVVAVGVDNLDRGISSMIFIANFIGSSVGLEPLHSASAIGHVNQDLLAFAAIQNEAVLLVQAGQRHLHLLDLDVSLALDDKQPLFDGLGVDVGEPGLDSPWQVLEPFLEVGFEEGALMILDFPMLDRDSTQLIIELDSLDCCGTILILAGFRSEPEVNVPGQLASLLRCLQVECDTTFLKPTSLTENMDPSYTFRTMYESPVWNLPYLDGS